MRRENDRVPVCRTRRSSGVNVCMAMGVCSAGGRRALPPSTAARATAEPEARGPGRGARRPQAPTEAVFPGRASRGALGGLSPVRGVVSPCVVWG